MRKFQLKANYLFVKIRVLPVSYTHLKNYIANYIIGDYVFIENVDIILVDGRSKFGNGVEVAVLNPATLVPFLVEKMKTLGTAA